MEALVLQRLGPPHPAHPPIYSGHLSLRLELWDPSFTMETQLVHRPSPTRGHQDPLGANQSNDITFYFIFNFYFDFLMLHNTIFHLFLYFCLLLLLFYLLKVRGNFCGLFIFLFLL